MTTDEAPLPTQWEVDWWEFCGNQPPAVRNHDLCGACRSLPCLPDCRFSFRWQMPRGEWGFVPLVIGRDWPGVTISQEDN